MTVVRMPDGVNVDFGNRSPDEIRTLILQKFPDMGKRAAGGAMGAIAGPVQAAAGAAATGEMPDEGALAASTRSVGNTLFPFMDEAVAGAAATIDPLLGRGGDTWDERYTRHLGSQRGGGAAAAEQHPIATGVGMAGAVPLLGPRAGAAMAVPRTAVPLAAKVAQGAKIGAGVGAYEGFGSGEGGFENRVTGAAESGALGALTGGALPIVAKGVGAVGKPFVDAYIGRFKPAEYGVRKVAERIAGGGRSVDVVARRMADAAARGDPVSLADVGGEQLQRLGRTVINQGGPGGTALKTKINAEAVRQGGRIAARVDEHLNVPGASYQEAKHAVMDARSHAAAPHYAEFYRTPVPYTHRLEGVLDTPAGRAGLAAARTNSLNRREPWAQWFANVTEDGRIIDARRVPDARALDEVRRAVRAQMEEAMAAPHGQPFARPRDTPRSIAIRSVYNDLSDEMMAAGETRPGARNGPFARANAAGLDNIQADEAIEFGRDVFKTDPRVIASRMGHGGASRDRVFNEGQRELVRIGATDAIREAIDSGNYTANKLFKFFSSPEDVARLRPLFRTARDWRAFRGAMLNEALKRKKFNTMSVNSTTTQQLLDSQEAGQLGEIGQAVTDVARGRPIAAVVGAAMRVLRRMGGMTPQAGDQIQRLISTRDIPQVQAIIRQLENIARSKASVSQKLYAARNLLTAAVASQEGQALAVKTNRQ